MRSSEHVVGKHDFTSFAASDPDRSARMKEAREEDDVPLLELRATSAHSFSHGREPRMN